MAKRVFKYGTGQEVPKGAKYLCTQVETVQNTLVSEIHGGGRTEESRTFNHLVWHYYEVFDELDPDVAF